MQQSHPIIELKGIRKSFGGVHALKGVDLTIEKGEIHALAGENGSGKSTLIKILSGVYRPDGGSITIDGVACGNITPIDAINRGIQVIYQDFSVFPNLTVRENIALNTEIRNHRKLVSRRRMHETAQAAVDRIGFEVDLDEKVEDLCVADKQLVAISRALLHGAKLIIMDEPTTALTRREVEKLFAIVNMLQAEGIAILFVSHKTDEVFEISRRYTILRSSERIVTGEVAELTRDDFALHMTGRKFVYERVEHATGDGDPVLEVRNLHKKNTFSDISFTVRRGEILCIAGLLGSGRTELAKALFGLERADSVSILVEGREVRIHSVQQAMAQRIGYVPEDRLTEGLFLQQSIFYNQVVSNLKAHIGHLRMLDRKAMLEESRRWAGELRVNTTDIAREVSTLSGGNQQKVILGRWLATNLRVLILNGPTVGVDIGAKFDIHRLLRELAGAGMAIVIISDDIPEIIACSDRALIMKNGRMRGEFITAQTDEQALNEAMFARQ